MKYRIKEGGAGFIVQTKNEGDRTYKDAATGKDREQLERIYNDAGYEKVRNR